MERVVPGHRVAPCDAAASLGLLFGTTGALDPRRRGIDGMPPDAAHGPGAGHSPSGSRGSPSSPTSWIRMRSVAGSGCSSGPATRIRCWERTGSSRTSCIYRRRRPPCLVGARSGCPEWVISPSTGVLVRTAYHDCHRLPCCDAGIWIIRGAPSLHSRRSSPRSTPDHACRRRRRSRGHGAPARRGALRSSPGRGTVAGDAWIFWHRLRSSWRLLALLACSAVSPSGSR